MFWNLFKRPIQPYHKGFLPTKDGHDIFFQQFGNAAADNRKTILVFHGGPGGSSKYKHTLHYNLKKYRVILFDQRGCGQSICANALYQNTTNDLLDDANRLLNHLQITGKIIVGGGSWGSTLALLFAQKYPHRVSKLVLNSDRKSVV